MAHVIVNHDVAHLDQTFTYGIPDEIASRVRVGSKLMVEFNKSQIEAVVLKIERVNTGTFKPISKVLNEYAYGDKAIELAQEIAERYGTSHIRMLQFVPERLDATSGIPIEIERPVERPRFIFETQTSRRALIAHLAGVNGAILIILPSEREVNAFVGRLGEELFDRVCRIEQKTNTKNRSALEEKIAHRVNPIIVGSRSAVFMQIANLQEMVIIDEQSEQYWEQRAPYWNVRDVALKRAPLEGLNLTFLGGLPSLELARLINIGYVRTDKPKLFSPRSRPISFDSATFHGTIREGIAKGPVLVSVALKDYAKILVCRKCGSQPSCGCGLPLKSISKSTLECVGCGSQSIDWSCRECRSTQLSLLSRGAERIIEELGKAFPNQPIYKSTSDRPLESTPASGIVVATPGMEPRDRNFSALIFLDAIFRLNRPTLRSEEHLHNHILRLMALLDDGAPVYVSLPQNHRISQSLNSKSPWKAINTLLSEREETRLPPWFRIIRISGEGTSVLNQSFKEEFPDIEASRVNSRNELILRVPIAMSPNVVSSLKSLQRYRSASKRQLFKIEIDPFDL